MNYDTLHVTVDRDDHPGHPPIVFYRIEINGERVFAEHPIHIIEFAKSAQIDGKFFFVTCGCGISDCAGIFEGIQVSHLPDAVTWSCPEPIDWGFTHDAPPEYRHYRFKPVQYVEAIEDAVRRIKAMVIATPEPCTIPVCGVTVEQLMMLDPHVFSTDRPGPIRRLIARHIVVEAHTYGIDIVANGIRYAPAELALPADIAALCETFSSMADCPRSVDDLARFAQYLEAGRDFCVALLSYLRAHWNESGNPVQPAVFMAYDPALHTPKGVRRITESFV